MGIPPTTAFEAYPRTEGERTVHSRRGPASALLAVMLVTALLIGSVSIPAVALDRDRYLRATPFVPLFSEANSCGRNASINSLGRVALRRRLAQIDRWFRHVHGEASNNFPLGMRCRGDSRTTLATKLTARGIRVSNYRNGSYVSQASRGDLNFGEAGTLERDAALSIATFWPGAFKGRGSDGSAGRLVGDVGPAASLIRVTATGSARPSGAAVTWPYLPSRGLGRTAGATSKNTHDFVSWVRIGTEIVKVMSVSSPSSDVVALEVRRGIFGTRAAAHSDGARVVAPAYVGGASGGFDGSPRRDDPRFALRYAIKIWQPGGYGWIARRIRTTFGRGMQGYNAVWLDITSCGLSNTVAGPGGAVSMWDDPKGAPMTNARWGQHQGTKLRGLRRILPNGIRLTGNSLHWVNRCNTRLLARTLDGGSLENWLKNEDWVQAMTQSLAIQRNDLPGIYWARWNQAGGSSVARYQRFTYGSLLLTRAFGAHRFRYGGPFSLARPDQLFFWGLGRPLGDPRTIADLRLGDTGLYVRRYSQGLVVVNPTSSSRTISVGSRSYDLVNLTSSGDPRPVTSITVAANDAGFVLRV
jgi:hypothetical protein